MSYRQQTCRRISVSLKVAASMWGRSKTFLEAFGKMTLNNGTEKRSRHKHRWQNHLCECGARQCAASELRRFNESGQCRCSTQPDSRYCKRHAYIDRVHSSRSSESPQPGLEAA